MAAIVAGAVVSNNVTAIGENCTNDSSDFGASGGGGGGDGDSGGGSGGGGGGGFLKTGIN